MEQAQQGTWAILDLDTFMQLIERETAHVEYLHSQAARLDMAKAINLVGQQVSKVRAEIKEMLSALPAALGPNSELPTLEIALNGVQRPTFSQETPAEQLRLRFMQEAILSLMQELNTDVVHDINLSATRLDLWQRQDAIVDRLTGQAPSAEVDQQRARVYAFRLYYESEAKWLSSKCRNAASAAQNVTGVPPNQSSGLTTTMPIRDGGPRIQPTGLSPAESDGEVQQTESSHATPEGGGASVSYRPVGAIPPRSLTRASQAGASQAVAPIVASPTQMTLPGPPQATAAVILSPEQAQKWGEQEKLETEIGAAMASAAHLILQIGIGDSAGQFNLRVGICRDIRKAVSLSLNRMKMLKEIGMVANGTDWMPKVMSEMSSVERKVGEALQEMSSQREAMQRLASAPDQRAFVGKLEGYFGNVRQQVHRMAALRRTATAPASSGESSATFVAAQPMRSAIQIAGPQPSHAPVYEPLAQGDAASNSDGLKATYLRLLDEEIALVVNAGQEGADKNRIQALQVQQDAALQALVQASNPRQTEWEILESMREFVESKEQENKWGAAKLRLPHLFRQKALLVRLHELRLPEGKKLPTKAWTRRTQRFLDRKTEVDESITAKVKAVREFYNLSTNTWRTRRMDAAAADTAHSNLAESDGDVQQSENSHATPEGGGASVNYRPLGAIPPRSFTRASQTGASQAVAPIVVSPTQMAPPGPPQATAAVGLAPEHAQKWREQEKLETEIGAAMASAARLILQIGNGDSAGQFNLRGQIYRDSRKAVSLSFNRMKMLKEIGMVAEGTDWMPKVMSEMTLVEGKVGEALQEMSSHLEAMQRLASVPNQRAFVGKLEGDLGYVRQQAHQMTALRWTATAPASSGESSATSVAAQPTRSATQITEPQPSHVPVYEPPAQGDADSNSEDLKANYLRLLDAEIALVVNAGQEGADKNQIQALQVQQDAALQALVQASNPRQTKWEIFESMRAYESEEESKSRAIELKMPHLFRQKALLARLHDLPLPEGKTLPTKKWSRSAEALLERKRGVDDSTRAKVKAVRDFYNLNINTWRIKRQDTAAAQPSDPALTEARGNAQQLGSVRVPSEGQAISLTHQPRVNTTQGEISKPARQASKHARPDSIDWRTGAPPESAAYGTNQPQGQLSLTSPNQPPQTGSGASAAVSAAPIPVVFTPAENTFVSLLNDEQTYIRKNLHSKSTEDVQSTVADFQRQRNVVLRQLCGNTQQPQVAMENIANKLTTREHSRDLEEQRQNLFLQEAMLAIRGRHASPDDLAKLAQEQVMLRKSQNEMAAMLSPQDQPGARQELVNLWRYFPDLRVTLQKRLQKPQQVASTSTQREAEQSNMSNAQSGSVTKPAEKRTKR